MSEIRMFTPCHTRAPLPQTTGTAHKQERHLNGAALVLTDGRELPITEQMILQALTALLRA